MSEELERTRKALGEATAWLQRLSTLGGTSSTGNAMAREGLAKVEFLLNPPPEFEEVPLERWAVVAPSGFVEMTVSSEGAAEREVEEEGGRYHGYQVAKLTGAIKRPVKRKVVREVEAKQVRISAFDDGTGTTGKTISVHNPTRFPFADFDECHGKTGTLIFRWTD